MDYAGVVALEILYMIAFLALISAGLAIVFGMMRVINLAHGEFVMLGGYTTIACSKAGMDIYFAMLVVAPVVVAAVGLLVERLIIRWLYGRIIDTMLATWGLSLLLVGLVTLIFGTSAVSVPAPIPGYQLGSYQMGGYNLFIIGITVLLLIGMWAVLRFTRAGLIARGAMQGPDVVAALGYDPKQGLHGHLYRRRGAVGTGRRGAGAAHGPAALVGGRVHRQGIHYRHHGRRGGDRRHAVERGDLRRDQPAGVVRVDAGHRRDRHAGARDHPAAPDAARASPGAFSADGT